MKKIISLVFKILFSVVLLGIVALLALGYYYNPERVKPMVVTYVKDHYNRTISIGDVSWKLFPRLGISIKDINLGNAPGFGDGNFAVLKGATVFVETMKLFNGKIHVSTLQLENPSANLVVNAKGTRNWDDLIVAQNSSENQTEKKTSDEKSQGIQNLELNIESIEVVDGGFTYEDQKTGEKYEIKDFNLSSQNVALGKDFPVDVKLKIMSNAPALNADIAAKGNVRVAANTTSYNLNAITLKGDIIISDLQSNGLKISNLKTPLTLEKGVLDMSAVSANLYGGSVNGSIVVDGQSEPADVAVKYDMKGTDITSMTRDLGVKQNFSGKLNMKGNLRFKAYPDKKQLTRSMSGNAAMNINNGALLGVDLPFWYDTGLAMLKSKNVTQLALGAVQTVAGGNNTGKTSFIGTWANFSLNSGLITNKDLNVYNDRVYGLGSGTINLINETVAYRFNISGVCKNGNEYKPAGQAIPLIISGSISNPKMNVDLGASVGNLIQNLAQPQNNLPGAGDKKKGDLGGQILQQIFK
jgi:uncharacterized protein involved in outer membrane biogenesis